MILPLTMLFISIIILLPMINIVTIDHNIKTIRQETIAKQYIQFHSSLVNFCENNSQICFKSDLIKIGEEQYHTFLLPEMLNTQFYSGIELYSSQGRIFTVIHPSQGPYGQIFNRLEIMRGLNRYTPEFIGVGSTELDKDKLTFTDGTTMILSDELKRKIKISDIVLVS